jgi:hypothetical protein
MKLQTLAVSSPAEARRHLKRGKTNAIVMNFGYVKRLRKRGNVDKQKNKLFCLFQYYSQTQTPKLPSSLTRNVPLYKFEIEIFNRVLTNQNVSTT